MKKTYVLLLTATYIASISCMQSSYAPLSHKASEDSRKATADRLQLTTQQTNIYTANQTGWKELNDIANLTHVNTATKEIINKHEEKPSLRTIVPKQQLMQQLYDYAYDFILSFTCNNKENPFVRNSECQNKKIVLLITMMNTAQSNGINEDCMAKASYDPDLSCMNSYSYTPLFFGCLKKYRLTSNKTDELLPPDSQQTTFIVNDNKLAQIVGISSTNEQFTTHIDQPAFNILLNCLSSLFKQTIFNVSDLANCLHYNDERIIQEHRSSYDTNLKNQFCRQAHSTLQGLPSSMHEKRIYIYDLLQIIDKAKITAQDIKSEKDLGYIILEAKRTGFFDWDTQEFPTHKKNLMALFCTLAKQYNKARGNKITPTDKQYGCYQCKNSINLALPDSFKSTVFDANVYAFAEFEQLMDNIVELMKTDDQSMQQCVDQLYPQRNQ